MIIEKKVGGPLWPLWPSGTVILRLLRVLEGADYRMLYLKKRLCPSGLNLTDIAFEWGLFLLSFAIVRVFGFMLLDHHPSNWLSVHLSSCVSALASM